VAGSWTQRGFIRCITSVGMWIEGGCGRGSEPSPRRRHGTRRGGGRSNDRGDAIYIRTWRRRASSRSRRAPLDQLLETHGSASRACCHTSGASSSYIRSSIGAGLGLKEGQWTCGGAPRRTLCLCLGGSHQSVDRATGTLGSFKQKASEAGRLRRDGSGRAPAAYASGLAPRLGPSRGEVARTSPSAPGACVSRPGGTGPRPGDKTEP
jgi:hypothetical protein